METQNYPQTPTIDQRGVGILARSLFRDMREQGYSPEQIVALSGELIQLVREHIAAPIQPSVARP